MNKKNFVMYVFVLIMLVGVVSLGLYAKEQNKKEDLKTNNSNIINKKQNTKNTTLKKKKIIDNDIKLSSYDYTIQSNGLDDFDLYFLKQENKEVNKVYSPLSIKYALAMLKEGTDGESYKQIDKVIGNYNSKKYENSANMSLANGLFIKNSFKDNIKQDYINNLNNKYNAEVIYDDFASANNVNSWVSNKTFNLVNNLLTDKTVNNSNFILVNALAIDMEWVKKIQSEYGNYDINYAHETTDYDSYEHTIYDENGKPTNKKEIRYRTYASRVTCLSWADYSTIVFNNKLKNAKVSELAADVNRYDIMSVIGEEKIRKTVKEAYDKWLDDGNEPLKEYSYDPNTRTSIEREIPIDEYLDNYIEEISKNYNQLTSSTDFSFYVDDSIKVFAKDLKEYNGTTLEYIGIMPIKEKLKDYIKNIDAKSINSIINNIKPLEMSSFKDGYITNIHGKIPLFKFEYDLDLMDDLKLIGITDAFDREKANLSRLTSDKNNYIENVKHKTNIEFSNDGIKSSAVLALAGGGASGGGFDYLYNIPIEEIDLTFDKPYMFIIRDKESKEVWFTGTVYEPIEYKTRHWDD